MKRTYREQSRLDAILDIIGGIVWFGMLGIVSWLLMVLY